MLYCYLYYLEHLHHYPSLVTRRPAPLLQLHRPRKLLLVHNDSYYPDAFGQNIYNNLGGYYKYMWYGYFRGDSGYDFTGEGDHGQFIYVSPHKNLIIIRNGIEYGQDWNWEPWIKAFYQFASEY